MGKTLSAPQSGSLENLWNSVQVLIAQNPELSALTFVLLLLFLAVLFRPVFQTRVKYRRKPYLTPVTFPKPPLQLKPLNPASPHDQLDAISAVRFETRPLLNKSEARLLPLLESITRAHGDGHRLMAQVSLGEVLRPRPGSASAEKLDAAYRSINSKRLDFAIFNRFGHLIAAIEYQGHGHHSHDQTFLRDAVKREAIRKAGVPYVEVPADFTTEGVTHQIKSILAPTRP
jgi:hypothetical protein